MIKSLGIAYFSHCEVFFNYYFQNVIEWKYTKCKEINTAEI